MVISTEGALITAGEFGEMLRVNRSTIWSWHNSGKIPRPIRVGGATRWKIQEIQDWISQNCPPREKWEQSLGNDK